MSTPLLEAVLRRRSLLRALRGFFDGRGFLEVETPVLIQANAPEPHIDALRVELGSAAARYLRTSPELALKRLLAAQAGDLYEIARVFRAGEEGSSHRVEFTLLEWYRAGSAYEALMDDCDALLAHCCQVLGVGPRVRGPAGACDLGQPAERLSVADAFRRFAGVDVDAFMDGDAAGLAAACRAARVRVPDEADFDQVFFSAFLSRVEPRLGLGRPTILHGWPAPMAALARLDPAQPRVALRFELYAAGYELANAFDELGDVAEQRRRFAAAAEARRDRGLDPYPADEGFLSDLARMPPSAGIALGVERLAMLLFERPDIAQVSVPWGC